MGVDLYQPFINPLTRETFRCISSTADAYTTDWIVEPGGYVPFEHVHLRQEEVFHVRQGRVRLVVNGRTVLASAGETVTVPRGVRQTAYNDGPEVLHCVLEYRPGLDSYAVFQCFGGLILDRDLDRRGIANPLKMMYFLRKMNARAVARPSFVPGPVFSLFMNMFLVVGSLAGWEGLYRKYTG